MPVSFMFFGLFCLFVVPCCFCGWFVYFFNKTDICVVKGAGFHSDLGGILKECVFLSRSWLSSTYILGLQGKYIIWQMIYCYFMARAEKLFGILSCVIVLRQSFICI